MSDPRSSTEGGTARMTIKTVRKRSAASTRKKLFIALWVGFIQQWPAAKIHRMDAMSVMIQHPSSPIIACSSNNTSSRRSSEHTAWDRSYARLSQQMMVEICGSEHTIEYTVQTSYRTYYQTYYQTIQSNIQSNILSNIL